MVPPGGVVAGEPTMFMGSTPAGPFLGSTPAGPAPVGPPPLVTAGAPVLPPGLPVMAPPPEVGHADRNRMILIATAGLLIISALAVAGALAFGGASHKTTGLVATNSGPTLPSATTAQSDNQSTLTTAPTVTAVPTTTPSSDTTIAGGATTGGSTTGGSTGGQVTPTTAGSISAAGWSTPRVIDQSSSGGTLQALSCVSGYTCFAGDDSGNVLSSTGRGAWTLASTSSSTVSINSVSCPTAKFCAAIASDESVMFWDGSNWSDPVTVDNNGALQGISCPSSSYCVAVDDSGFAYTYSGTATKWASTAATGSGGDGLSGVSCPSASFCVAAPQGTSGAVYMFDGHAWKEVTVGSSNSSNTIDVVSCSSSNFCEAIDDGGLGYTFNGASWSTAGDSPVTSATVEGLSCPVDGFCMAVNNSGGVISYSGGSWSRPVQIDGNNSFVAVSCSGASACTAADDQDNILYYSGH
jgi:hypothetical protein